MHADQLYRELLAKLGSLLPEAEIRRKAELAAQIHRLKKEKNALILGHNYMEPALYHSIPDVVGDSLALARLAAETDKEMIVVCGVRFMAETAKILNPQKTVLIPALDAGCSLAESITAEDVRRIKQKFPGIPVVTYVNTYADVKAESDICCTSGNAAKVVEALDSDTVIFLPDEFLARNVARQTGKRVISASEALEGKAKFSGADLIAWQGRCEVHERFSLADVEKARAKYPGVVVLAHPECDPQVTAAADFAGSTSAMMRFVQENEAPAFLLLTESSMAENLSAAYPEKNIVRMPDYYCPHMRRITLEDTLKALQNDQFRIELDEDLRSRAEKAVQRMIEIA